MKGRQVRIFANKYDKFGHPWPQETYAKTIREAKKIDANYEVLNWEWFSVNLPQSFTPRDGRIDIHPDECGHPSEHPAMTWMERGNV